MDFHQGDVDVKTQKINEFVGGKHRTIPSPFCPQTPPEEVLKIHANISNNPITALIVLESPKLPRPTGNLGRGTR